MKNIGRDMTPLPLDVLVIHMRNGDIFSKHIGDGATKYIVPPLAFFQTVIESQDFRKVIVVHEKTGENPLMELLDRYHPNVVLQCRSIEEDATTVVRAQHVCTSTGTFVYALFAALAPEGTRSLHYFDHPPQKLEKHLRHMVSEAFVYEPIVPYIDKWRFNMYNLNCMINYPRKYVKLARHIKIK